jgi:hypothetical protein
MISHAYLFAARPSRRAKMRKPSCLISCSQPGPEGSAFAGDGRHGSMIPRPGRVRSRNNMRPPLIQKSSQTLSGASFLTFNQEVFEKEFALAAVEWTATAKARQFTLGRRLWRGFKSDNFVLCRADGAMEERCYRFGHKWSPHRTSVPIPVKLKTKLVRIPFLLCLTELGAGTDHSQHGLQPPRDGRPAPRSRGEGSGKPTCNALCQKQRSQAVTPA